jgi:hypothetical protein
MRLSLPAIWLLAITASLLGAMSSRAQTQTDAPTKTWNLEQALDAYQTLTGKTILRKLQLPALTLTLTNELSSNGPAALAHLESELNRSGLQVLQDGPHFVWVVPRNGTELLTNLPLRGAELALLAKQLPANNPELLPAGAINFPSTDLENVLPIYAELRDRTILRPTFLPAARIRFVTACPLSKEEAIYAMTTVLALNGVGVVEDGEKFLQVVPRNELSKVNAAAPKATAGEEVVNPQQVPSLGETETPPDPPKLSGTRSVNPGAEIGHEVSQARRLFFNFLHQQDPKTRYVDRLLSLYAGLTGKDALPCRAGGNLIRFSVRNPLTKKELLYAIETTFALNDFMLVSVGDNSIRLENKK